MPPKAVKKTPAGPGARRGGRGGKGPNRSQNKVKPVTEEPMKVDKPVKVAEPAKVDESVKAEEPAVVSYVNSDKVKAQVEDVTPVSSNDKAVEAISEKEKEVKPVQEFKSVDREVIPFKKDGVKDSVDEYEKGERLDLDDNDPEYEPEEYVGVDYDEKETEPEDFQEEEDPVEGEVGEEEEEEVEMVEEEEEEIEEVQEKHEGEGDEDEEDGNPVEEHAQIEDHAEEEDHHDIVKERRKRKEFEVFVGGLDKDTCEDDLRKVFSAVGDVTEVRLMMNPLTLKNKGFAFIRFATVEQAKRACSELKTPVVCGKKCGVKPSQDSDTLFLGNICTTWTKEALKEKLKHYGVDNIEELTLVEDNNNEGTNRGFAFMEFSSRSEAMDAFKRLQKRDVVFGVDRPAKVSFADSFIDPGDEIMAKVKTVFVDGLLASWDEDRVRELLKVYGEIEKVELARNMPSAKRKDFGFVSFSTHDAAVICAKGINNEELGDGSSKAKVRARLSRPLERDKRKRVTHADPRRGRGGGGGPVRGPPIHSSRGPWSRPPPRSVPTYRGSRSVPSRIPPVVDRGFKRPSIPRERRHMMAIPPRHRPVAPPPRSYPRRQPGPPYPKSSLKRGYARQEEVPPPPPPRRRATVADYSRAPPERRMPSYREEEYAPPPRGSAYAELPPRGPSRPVPRRDYADEGYEQRYERPPPPAYREERTPRDYDTIPGSKRTYSALDDVSPRYADTGVRQSRARVDYERSGSGSQYVEVDAERLPRSSLGYNSSRTRSSISSQDPRGIYSSSRQDTSYGGGSYGGDVNGGGMYSSDYGSSDYASRGNDVGGGGGGGSGGGGGGSSYSSLYSGRGFGGGGSSYMGSGGSGSSYY